MAKKEVDNIRVGLLKKFGSNAIIMGADHEKAQYGRISTGSINLDLKLGGGIPIGRMTQISGAKSTAKSTLCDHIVKNAQTTKVEWIWTERKESKGRELVEEHPRKVDGLICAYLDVEGTKTIDWTRDTIGVDTDNWLYAQPSGLEECLEMAHQMQKDGVHLIVIDSIDSLEPTKEYESQMGESVQMGLKPKMIGEYCRKYTATNNMLVRRGDLPCTVILINQLREKIGAYGDPEYCLHYDTPIPLVDGRTLPIGEIVENRIEGEVWSYNFDKNIYEPKRILDWKYNGNIESKDEYYTIIANGVGSKNGVFSVTATYDHKILTDTGWKEAQDLTLHDKLCTKVERNINGTLLDFLAGTLVGDSTLVKSHKNTAYLRLQDSENEEYLKWKIGKLSALLPMEKYPSGNTWRSKSSVELLEIKNKLGNRDPLFLFRNYSDMGLAVYYMDDGSLNKGKYATISINRFKGNEEHLIKIQRAFLRVGLECTFNIRNGKFHFNKDNSNELFRRISRYIPPCMQYKLPPEFRGLYEEFELQNNPTVENKYIDIKSIRVASDRKLRRKGRYDINVGEHHNFLAGGTDSGFVVHNTPGGRAIEFYISVDLRLRRGDWIIEGTGESKEIVGQVIKFKSNKNKTYKQQQSGEFDFYFEDTPIAKAGEIDTFKEVVVAGINYGVIERAGSWFKYRGKNIAQGADNTVMYLRENPEVFKQVKDELFSIVEREANAISKGSEA